jgi:hypothetical protein
MMPAAEQRDADHDRVLEETLDALPSQDRSRLEAGFQRFVHLLAEGLATNRAVSDHDENGSTPTPASDSEGHGGQGDPGSSR